MHHRDLKNQSDYVDDDDTADFQIILANKPVLSAADFVL
jgi:hypothetical protein